MVKKGQHNSLATEFKKGNKHLNWKGGVCKDIKEYKKRHLRKWRNEHKEHFNKYMKEWQQRHREYVNERNNRWKNNHKEHISKYMKVWMQNRRALEKTGGELSIKIIQMVYEDNIKQYGTLTCIYCLKPIEFGKDSLEHKIPLSRGGTNEYENLGIACLRCNVSKNNKTEAEYKEYKKEVEMEDKGDTVVAKDVKEEEARQKEKETSKDKKGVR